MLKNPKQNIGKQMLKAFFYASNRCVFTFEPIQKSTSIYNGLSAEPEMVVSLNVCVCVHFFFVPEKLSIRPILWMKQDHSDSEEMLLCSNFPWI